MINTNTQTISLDHNKTEKRIALLEAKKLLLKASLIGANCAATAAVTFGASKIFHANPFSSDIPGYEIVTEEVDTMGKHTKTYENVEAIDADSRFSDEIYATVYGKWENVDNHYYRTKTDYTIKNTGININNILSEEAINNLDYKITSENTQEGFNLTEKELNADGYISMITTYKGKEIVIQQPVYANIGEIGLLAAIAGISFIFGGLSYNTVIKSNNQHTLYNRINNECEDLKMSLKNK